jgi:hypothetical protein
MASVFLTRQTDINFGFLFILNNPHGRPPFSVASDGIISIERAIGLIGVEVAPLLLAFGIEQKRLNLVRTIALPLVRLLIHIVLIDVVIFVMFFRLIQMVL